ncbi:partial HTH-type transcriptional regulator MalT, partial [Anaerolineae bacterium]
MSVSIIPTKIIIPRRPGGVLRRPRLTDYLHENLERKLMLVTAPAGYGKTTLLIDFAQDADMPVCWYTLDEGDRDLAVFLAHLIASLQRRFPNFGQRSRSLVDNGVPAVGTAAAALVADIVSDITEYFILVLDDWHLVSDEGPIRDLIDHVLRYLPEHAHLIVAGRTLLRGPLVRLAAQGAVAGIGAADLRFTGDEVRAVLASRFNLSISDEQAARFAVEAEGWITAILLTSNSAWQDVLGRLRQVRDSADTLYEYLASEVFDRLEPALQEFLLASAVPRQFTAELCNDLCC